MIKPNLFIVGAPKCGSTSLHYYINQHPEIALSTPKELNYFCSDVKEVYTPRAEEEYLSFFDYSPQFKFRGEGTPYYIISESASEGIKRMSPDAKIIITLRRPVDVLRSIYDQLVFAGKEKSSTLDEALKIERTINKKQLSDIERQYFDNKCYLDIPKFSRHVKRYQDTFGKKNVLIILFDDLKDNTVATLQQCFRFLGLREYLDIDKSVKNRAMVNRSKFLKTFVTNPPNWSKNILRIILPSKEYRNKLFSKINKLNAKPKLIKAKMSRRTEAHLIEHFKEEVFTLSKLIDKDLSHWNKMAAPHENLNSTINA